MAGSLLKRSDLIRLIDLDLILKVIVLYNQIHGDPTVNIGIKHDFPFINDGSVENLGT